MDVLNLLRQVSFYFVVAGLVISTLLMMLALLLFLCGCCGNNEPIVLDYSPDRPQPPLETAPSQPPAESPAPVSPHDGEDPPTKEENVNEMKPIKGILRSRQRVEDLGDGKKSDLSSVSIEGNECSASRKVTYHARKPSSSKSFPAVHRDTTDDPFPRQSPPPVPCAPKPRNYSSSSLPDLQVIQSTPCNVLPENRPLPPLPSHPHPGSSRLIFHRMSNVGVQDIIKEEESSDVDNEPTQVHSSSQPALPETDGGSAEGSDRLPVSSYPEDVPRMTAVKRSSSGEPKPAVLEELYATSTKGGQKTGNTACYIENSTASSPTGQTEAVYANLNTSSSLQQYMSDAISDIASEQRIDLSDYEGYMKHFLACRTSVVTPVPLPNSPCHLMPDVDLYHGTDSKEQQNTLSSSTPHPSTCADVVSSNNSGSSYVRRTDLYVLYHQDPNVGGGDHDSEEMSNEEYATVYDQIRPIIEDSSSDSQDFGTDDAGYPYV